jgi:hypothetical protein
MLIPSRRDLRGNKGKRFLNPRQQGVEQPVLGRDNGIEFVAGHIKPPAAATRRTDCCQAVLVEQLRKHGIATQTDFSVTVQKQHDSQQRFRILRQKDIDGTAIHGNRLPGLQQVLDARKIGAGLSGRTGEKPFQGVEHGECCFAGDWAGIVPGWVNVQGSLRGPLRGGL